jgi:hypothetical protein
MDHLPAIEDAAYPLPEIPYLGHIISYDGQGFYSFPKRHGWTLDLSQKERGPFHEDDSLSTPDNIAALLQAWLFFGVLDEIFSVVLGLQISLEDFVETRSGQASITTKHLRRYIDQWMWAQDKIDEVHYNGQKTMDEDFFTRQQVKVRTVIVEIHNFFLGFLDFKDYSWAQSITTDFHLSILILGETLRNAGLYIWRVWEPLPSHSTVVVRGFKESSKRLQEQSLRASPNDPGRLKDYPLEKIGFQHSRNILQERFTALGWCPNERRMVFELLLRENTGLFLVSRLKRPFSATQLSHVSCTSERCRASQIKPRTYKTKHTAKCANSSACREMEIDISHISTMIEQGRVPLFRIHAKGRDPSNWSGGIELETVDSGNYVAISHVWAHGLGNESRNALPECQLMRIKDIVATFTLAEGLPAEPAIWIDTLCIPVGLHLQSLRDKAVGNINTVFREAGHVLAIDADLLHASIHSSPTELCTRLICCGWMRGLWTLNEAVITDSTPNCQKLWIILSDGPLLFNNLFSRTSRMLSPYHPEKALQVLATRLPQRTMLSNTLAALSVALEYRTTSRVEDEPLCLASILGLDLERILEHSTASKRMQAWYSMLHELPTDILFLNAPRRLTVPGYLWAPASFLSHGKSLSAITGDRRFSRIGTVTERGLLVDVKGFLVSDLEPSKPSRRRADFPFMSPTGGGNVWTLSKPLVMDAHPYHDIPIEDARVDQFEASLCSIKRAAVLENPSVRTDAIVVSIWEEDNDVFYCHYVMQARISRAAEFKLAVEMNLHKVQQKDLSITVRLAPEGKKWCVG